MAAYTVERRNFLTGTWEPETKHFTNSGAASEYIRVKRGMKCNSRAGYRLVTPGGHVSLTYPSVKGGR